LGNEQRLARVAAGAEASPSEDDAHLLERNLRHECLEVIGLAFRYLALERMIASIQSQLSTL
jgi:hypothetical protein